MLQDTVKRKHRGPPYNQEWIEEEIRFSFPYSNFIFIKLYLCPTDIEFLRQSLAQISAFVTSRINQQIEE